MTIIMKENIKFLVVHCSDTEDKKDLRALDIHKMHINFGWDGIGYHKIINRSGKIENGRPEFWIGAHVRGKNSVSLGVCLIGKEKFTKNQFRSLERVLRRWKIFYPNAKIVGHCDFKDTNKTCPNFNVNMWVRSKNI